MSWHCTLTSETSCPHSGQGRSSPCCPFSSRVQSLSRAVQTSNANARRESDTQKGRIHAEATEKAAGGVPPSHSRRGTVSTVTPQNQPNDPTSFQHTDALLHCTQQSQQTQNLGPSPILRQPCQEVSCSSCATYLFFSPRTANGLHRYV